MTDTEKIELVRIFLNDEDTSDAVISAYLDVAEQRIVEAEYPFKDTAETDDDDNPIWTMSAKYDKLQCELASRMLFRRGFNGQISSNENGIIREWASEDDIDIINRVTPKVGF